MNKNIVISVLILLIGGAILTFVAFPGATSFLHNSSSEEREEADDTPGYTVTPIPVDETTALPNLDREIQFSDSVPGDVQVLITDKVNTLKAILRDTPTDAGAWFDLAVYYHNANDYEGAREIWEFLVMVVPGDTTAYENLAKLYHFSLQDFAQSESYFKQSLAIDSESLSAYLGLFDLYRYSYKTETSAAADIMNQAIVQFPEKLDLVLALGVYYRDRGNNAQARTVLEGGLNKARDAGDVALIAAFGQEIERIPQ